MPTGISIPCASAHLSRREYDLFRAFVSKSLRVHRISRVIKQVSGTVFMEMGVHAASGRNAKPSEPFL
jgi:hypothetical protein